MNMKQSGVTLVELLVGMAILGIILTALMSLTGLTLNTSARVTADAYHLNDLKDASAYISDNFRRAAQIITSTTVNGTSCNINGSNAACVGLVIPEARTSTAIDTFVFLVYRVEPRASLPATHKTADSWADANTFVIQEYRQVLCTACSSYTAPTSLTSTASLVIDGLALDNVPAPFSVTGNSLTLSLQVKQRQRGQVRFTPASAPYQLNVMGRNIL